jgi:hypothetical protein
MLRHSSSVPNSFRLILVGLLAVAILGVPASVVIAEDEESQVDPRHPTLPQDLIGTWELVSSKREEPPAGEKRLKFFTGKHWCITTSDESGNVLYHHGGTYVLKGDEYTETVTYANSNTAQLIGAKLKFKITVNGDKFIQVGIENPYTEVWKRAK